MKIEKKEIVFSTNWFNIEAKTVSETDEPYFTLNTTDFVTILALNNTSEILFVKQYRPALELYTLELPSGHVEKGQTSEEAAHSELLEETGYMAKKLELLGCISPDTGRFSNKAWCYFTNEIEKVEDEIIDDGIELHLIKIEEVKKLIKRQEINHSMNLSVLFLAKDKVCL
mgnify:CR=1 FL=1